MKIRFASTSWTMPCTCLLFFLQFSHAIAAAPILEKNSLPATGRQETILNIPSFGRYAMLCQSEQGTALGFINKMSGPSPISGKPGIEDGRIDAFLDTGDYKIVTYADEHGSGKVDLKVMPFTEKTDALTPQLIEHKLVSAQLADFQQRFSAKQRHVIDERGTYWVSTLHSGYGEDSADATSILTDSTRHREVYVDDRAISLDTSSGWQRRFNILDTLTLYFKVNRQFFG
ncbi:MAG: hypothetical protein GY820_32795 [Gammaproteobacteria bacterium]|nr:hypothetical protein [Gammaproteobacteria bacterium]